jgi:hypothetical protein
MNYVVYYLYWIYVWTMCLSGFTQKMAVPPRKLVSLASPRKWVAPLGAPPDPNGPRPDGRPFLSRAQPKRTDSDVLAVRNGSARWRCPKATAPTPPQTKEGRMQWRSLLHMLLHVCAWWWAVCALVHFFGCTILVLTVHACCWFPPSLQVA